MGFLRSLASNISGAAPGLATAFHNKDALDMQRQAQADQEDETLRNNFLKGDANNRANDADARAADMNTAQIAHLNDDGWGKPVPASGPNGESILVQVSRNGDIRPAVLGSQGSSGTPQMPGVQMTGNTPTSMAGPVAAPLSALGSKPSLASSIQAPQTPTTTLQTTPATPLQVPGAPQSLRPIAKPVAAPKIDPNSQAGIDAAVAKAQGAAAARAANPVARPTTAAPKIDPNSPAGITADSTKAANRAALKPGGMTGGMGSGGLGGLAKTSSAITEMDQANQMLTPFENAPGRNITGLDYFTGLRAKMYDAHGVVDQATHAAAFAQLNKTNPDLANYLRAAEMWALADGAVSGKTSDFRTKLDGFVSAIGPNAGAAQIKNTQTARATRLAELQKFQPAMEAAAQRFVPQGGGRGGAPQPAGASTGNITLGGGGPVTPTERAALKAQGFTDAQINAIKP